MAPAVRSLGEITDLMRSPYAHEDLAGDDGAPTLFVELDGTAVDDETVARLRALPLVVVGLGSAAPGPDPLRDAFDVLLDAGDAAAVAAIDARAAANPIASIALVQLMRASQRLGVVEGLWAESATYSMLQAGPEFGAWIARERRPPTTAAERGAPLRVVRHDGEIDLTFCRPEVRNAFGFEVRDALVEALQLAAADGGVTSVVLRGEGRSFCSGGDLREFGTTPDPATAHLVRSVRSAGYWLSILRPRLRAEIHGACVGSGIELAAFASHVRAAADTTIELPEVSMGLVPGAGGTVSIPRRIGRHRFVLLALSGTSLDATTALEWGLVDAVGG